MYLPKSHITPDLYSNGELSIIGSNTPYVGYYFQTINGKNYTGRYPNDGKNLELTKSTPQGQNEDNATYEIDYRFVGDNNTYSAINRITPESSISQQPIPFYPSPSVDDYKLGEFTRYFSKKVNEDIYVETSGLFKNSLYIGISLPWAISGDKDKVYQVNKNIVKLKEQENNIRGLGAFLRFNYLKFYR